MPKVIERSWARFPKKWNNPNITKSSLQRNHKSFLFAFLCHSPLFTTASSFPQALQGPAWQAFLVYFSFHRTLHTVGNKEYTEAGMWPKKRREISLASTISWSEMRQQNNEDITVYSVNHPTTRTCRLVRRFCSRQNHLALPVEWNLFSIP